MESQYALSNLPNAEKEAWLTSTFSSSSLKPLDIKLTLKKCNGNIDAALDELFSIEYLESTGQRQKGIDAFLVDEDLETRVKKKKWKKKGRSKKTGGATLPKYESSIVHQTSGSHNNVYSSNSTTSEADTTSDVSDPTPRKLTTAQVEEVQYLATRVNLAESEVSKVYLASGCSLTDAADNLVDTFQRIGLTEAHPSLQARVKTLGDQYPAISRDYVQCIVHMTESLSDARDIAVLLQDLYRKENKKTKLHIDYTLKPISIEMDEMRTSSPRNTVDAKTTINKPIQPLLALRPLASSSQPNQAVSAASPGGNSSVWTTVARKNINSNINSNGLRPTPSVPLTAPSSATWSAAHLAHSRDSAREVAVHAFRKGSSNPLWKQAAAVYSARGAHMRRAATAAEADALVGATRTHDLIDLHGVFVADGTRIAMQAIREWWDQMENDPRVERLGRSGLAKERPFKIVTGQGRHSDGGRSKLRPALLKTLGEDGWLLKVGTGHFDIIGRR